MAEETVYVVLIQVAQEGYEDAATQTLPMHMDGVIQDDAVHVIEDEVCVNVLEGVGVIDGVDDEDALSQADAESVGVGESEAIGVAGNSEEVLVGDGVGSGLTLLSQSVLTLKMIGALEVTTDGIC